ncbi:GntR family transcriptional regulator [Roseobacter sp. WL0113]|uniref:GntR family transcriptional regulator n=1 Tax=Roseobacter sinensis TaxID=2931391 RepID=A0ABT3BH06_9RHOB|nr:GntR family transcriptional regulator [Roseobacter sp. WL0113]
MSTSYARIANRIAAQIATGELPVGTRLPPQRVFAHEMGIAASTASRLYERCAGAVWCRARLGAAPM